MNYSGDAAEQIVRISLEGAEFALRITGAAAKEMAAFLAAAMKSQGNKLKLKGKSRMAAMLKSGKALEIFSVKDSDLKKFYQGAKQYGIVYCVLRSRNNTPDGLCDVMVKADDAPKISRVIERFRFATVDKAKIENDIVSSRSVRSSDTVTNDVKQGLADKKDTTELLNELLGENVSEDRKPVVRRTGTVRSIPLNPKSAETEKSHPSEPISENSSLSAGVTSNKPSVKEAIREIKAARAKKETDMPKLNERNSSKKPELNTAAVHRQLQTNRKKGKSKERI